MDVLRGPSIAALKTARRAVILIHGFANSEQRASQSFFRFMFSLSDFYHPHRPSDFSTFFGFHWPGDHRLPVVTRLTYSSRVTPATQSGHALGRLLAELETTSQIVLVAHSLGCRVLLAALEWLARPDVQRRAHIRAAFLMAAAVPVPECEFPNRFSTRYQDTEYAVFYSNKDRALGLAFGPGQWLFDRSAQAVGLHGKPEEGRWDIRTYTGYGHSDYWPSRRIAERLGRILWPTGVHLLPQRCAAPDRSGFETGWALPARIMAPRP